MKSVDLNEFINSYKNEINSMIAYMKLYHGIDFSKYYSECSLLYISKVYKDEVVYVILHDGLYKYLSFFNKYYAILEKSYFNFSFILSTGVYSMTH